MNKKYAPYLLLILLAIAFMALKKCKPALPKNKQETTTVYQRGLNRNPAHIKYSKHAACRMNCRHIDESEIKDILKNGTINYRKSQLDKDECHKRYAVEGYSKDQQHIRLIVADCADEATIITCIDLGTEWECHCEGDEEH